MTTTDILDPAGIERLRQLGGDRFAGEMITLFLDFARKKFDEAKQARASADFPKLGAAAHAIKSSAGNVGAHRVQYLCSQIEHLADQPHAAVVGPMVDELEAAMAAVIPCLEEKRRSLA